MCKGFKQAYPDSLFPSLSVRIAKVCKEINNNNNNNNNKQPKLCSGQQATTTPFGTRMLKLAMMGFHERGPDMENMKIFLPMFKLMVKMFEPFSGDPTVPREFVQVLHDLNGFREETDENTYELLQEEKVYRSMSKFLLMAPMQEIALRKYNHAP